MAEPLDSALGELRDLLTDSHRLVRAVAAGRRRGETPQWTRVTLRPVPAKAGTRLQLVADDGSRPVTRNVSWGDEAQSAVDELLAEPFGNWHVETTDQTWQLRVTKRGEAQVHRGTLSTPATAPTPVHDRVAEHILDPGDPIFAEIGGTAAKRRQVDAFLRSLAATLGVTAHRHDVTSKVEQLTAEAPPTYPELPNPLRVVDLGCGNAYLTFAAYRFLSGLTDQSSQTRAYPDGSRVQLVGVDIREDQRIRNTELAHRLGWQDSVRFQAGTIASAQLGHPHVVLALHACDTATDEALAQAVRSGATWILAAPCCHHDVATQLRQHSTPEPYELLIRHSILRERFADILTDALRAALLRLHGYRVDIVEFVDSKHTPRNTMLRARRTGVAPSPAQIAEYATLVRTWQVTPHLATLLAPDPAPTPDPTPALG